GHRRDRFRRSGVRREDRRAAGPPSARAPRDRGADRPGGLVHRARRRRPAIRLTQGGGLAMWRHNVDLLAYHDLDGRSGFKLALQEVDGRFFLYVAGFWHCGWSILEVTDPEHPQLVRWLPGPPNTMTIQVQVADGLMITGLEHPPPGLTLPGPAAAPQDGFLIWDVHDPARPQLLGRWVSGGTCTHRTFYHGGPC